MTGRRLVAASESAPSEADPSHDCAEGAVSEADQVERQIRHAVVPPVLWQWVLRDTTARVRRAAEGRPS